MPIWALTVQQSGLADYSSFEKAEQAGFSPDSLVDDDYKRCQAEGKRLREAGFAGVVAPSAALTGVVNVTLFGRRILSAWGVQTRLASSIPGCVVAVGSPFPGLAARVRYRGEAHSGYDLYVAGLPGLAQANDPDQEHAHVRRLEEPRSEERGPGSAEDQ
jgi:hypothetical protein